MYFVNPHLVYNTKYDFREHSYLLFKKKGKKGTYVNVIMHKICKKKKVNVIYMYIYMHDVHSLSN